MSARRAAAALALAAALGASLLPASAAKPALDERIRQQQSKVHATRLQLQQKRQQLGNVQARIGSYAEQLATTNRNISAVQAHLDQLDAAIASTQRKLAWIRVQLDAAQATLQRHNDALRRRLIDAYENGDLGYVAVLLDARSFSDFVERWNDIGFVIKADEATIRERRADADRVAAIQTSLLSDEASLESAQGAADQQRHALDALAQERRNLLDVADNERRRVAQQVEQLSDISDQAEGALEALVAEKQREEEERRLEARRAAGLAGEPLPPDPGAPTELVWPVAGPITSPFGMRMHPVYGRPVFNAGIDIAAALGTTVSAAAAGRVIVASYQGECGNMIAIDHGGGMSTVYCHLSQMFVGVGQDVEGGQAIGAVGMSGDATGPHLHFEVMENAHPVDPISFLH